MKENGATILYVSHNMEQVRNLCSRIVWLEHGRVRSIGDADELCREYQEAEDEDEKEDVELLIKRELKDSSAFTAFKRWLIWDNRIYSELEKYIPEAKAPSIGKNEY